MAFEVRRVFVASIVVLAVAACESTAESLSTIGSSRLTKAEALAHVSGNTEVWSKGGGYYSPDANLFVKWEGQDGAGIWEVTDDGDVCYTVDIWGNAEECHHYVNDNGVIKLVYNNSINFREILPGNQLNTL
jgi:hypothetical protein